MTDSDKKEIFLERIIEENKGFIYKIISQYYCDKFEPEELFNEAVYGWCRWQKEEGYGL